MSGVATDWSATGTLRAGAAPVCASCCTTEGVAGGVCTAGATGVTGATRVTGGLCRTDHIPAAAPPAVPTMAAMPTCRANGNLAFLNIDRHRLHEPDGHSIFQRRAVP